MDDNDRIKIGDKVTIQTTLLFTNMTVLGTPDATGDSWKFKSDTDEIFYIQQYDYMKKIKKAQ